MKLRILKKGFIPIKMEDIESFENEIGYKLPLEYKMFLIKYNGCYCNFDKIFFKEINDLYKENLSENSEFCFYCNVFHTNNYHKFIERYTEASEIISLEDLKEIFKITVDEYDLTRKYIIILMASCGSEAIYTSLNSETYGHIYFCDMTHEKKFIHIANNLEEFLNSFEPDPDYPLCEEELL